MARVVKHRDPVAVPLALEGRDDVVESRIIEHNGLPATVVVADLQGVADGAPLDR
jgi:hypothetical protein